MTRNRLKQRARAGESILGAWVFSGSPAICEIYALAGYDLVLIDAEHTPIDMAETLACVRAVEAGGGDAMVRVPSHDYGMFKRMLDAGIHSLMVPMIDTVDQAKTIISSCLYPPHGRRGYAASVARSGLYGFDEDYIQTAHEDTFLALQVESDLSSRNAAAIAALPGADCLFIGANDLAGSMGKLGQVSDPEVLASVDRAAASTLAAGKVLGTIPIPGRDASTLAAMGYGIVVGECDIATIKEGALADIAQHKAKFPGRRR
jgi:4-hydroxy-2-oxoheptanedioate aldolase